MMSVDFDDSITAPVIPGTKESRVDPLLSVGAARAAVFSLARRNAIAYTGQGVVMKLAVGITAFLWLLCGLVGAWMLDDLDADHWKKIARGPITLADALNQHPVTIQGPD